MLGAPVRGRAPGQAGPCCLVDLSATMVCLSLVWQVGVRGVTQGLSRTEGTSDRSAAALVLALGGGGGGPLGSAQHRISWIILRQVATGWKTFVTAFSPQVGTMSVQYTGMLYCQLVCFHPSAIAPSTVREDCYRPIARTLTHSRHPSDREARGEKNPRETRWGYAMLRADSTAMGCVRVRVRGRGEGGVWWVGGDSLGEESEMMPQPNPLQCAARGRDRVLLYCTERLSVCPL